MENLYEFFEVPENASPDQIKKSFRKKSKKLHPDTGGDREEFEKACKYYKILINSSSRSDYDNGTYHEEKDDLFEFIIGVIFKIIESYDPSLVNIISKSTAFINEQVLSCRNNIHSLKEKKKKYNKFLENLVEKSDNMLITIINNHISQIDVDIKNIYKQVEFYMDAINFIENSYDYKMSSISVALDNIRWQQGSTRTDISFDIDYFGGQTKA